MYSFISIHCYILLQLAMSSFRSQSHWQQLGSLLSPVFHCQLPNSQGAWIMQDLDRLERWCIYRSYMFLWFGDTIMLVQPPIQRSGWIQSRVDGRTPGLDLHFYPFGRRICTRSDSERWLKHLFPKFHPFHQFHLVDRRRWAGWIAGMKIAGFSRLGSESLFGPCLSISCCSGSGIGGRQSWDHLDVSGVAWLHTENGCSDETSQKL